MTALPEDVAALLTAIRDALDVPRAVTLADDLAAAELLRQRASDVTVVVDSVLKGDDPGASAANLREWTDQYPVAYTPYTPREQQVGGEGR